MNTENAPQVLGPSGYKASVLKELRHAIVKAAIAPLWYVLLSIDLIEYSSPLSNYANLTAAYTADAEKPGIVLNLDLDVTVNMAGNTSDPGCECSPEPARR